MRRASPRAPRREKSSFSLQLIKGIMVVENRLCCPWLLMSCLQAANEDCIEFCCLSYYITLQSSVETSSERWPSAVRVSKTLSCTIVFYVYGEQKGNSLDALLFFFLHGTDAYILQSLHREKRATNNMFVAAVLQISG